MSSDRVTCGATKPVRIETQIEQTARCILERGHAGAHIDIVLDSDDNPIRERWT